jgi:hypothetical protein
VPPYVALDIYGINSYLPLAFVKRGRGSGSSGAGEGRIRRDERPSFPDPAARRRSGLLSFARRRMSPFEEPQGLNETHVQASKARTAISEDGAGVGYPNDGERLPQPGGGETTRSVSGRNRASKDISLRCGQATAGASRTARPRASRRREIFARPRFVPLFSALQPPPWRRRPSLALRRGKRAHRRAPP